MFDLANFIIEEELYNSKKHNKACILGYLNSNTQEKIILCLSYIPFENFHTLLNHSEIKSLEGNDRFYNFILTPNFKTKLIVNMIKPALEKDIQKYRTHNKINFCETPYYFNTKVSKYINENYCKSEQLNWIYNILLGKEEQVKIIFENKEFILLPNICWDNNDINSLYYLALIKDKNIRCLRDIRSNHINILEDIDKGGKIAIKKKYGIEENEIITYVHYYPSYYHFHIHFVYLKNDLYETGTGRNYYLKTIINNLKLDPDYYKKTNMEMIIREDHPNINLS
jgi:m7GpppX diphosphatase